MRRNKKIKYKSSKRKKYKIKKVKKRSVKRKFKRIKKNKPKNKKKNSTYKKKFGYKLKKTDLPIDRIKKIKLPKLKLKKIKFYKIKKKKIFKIKKRINQAIKSSLQQIINFILYPFFKAYDNYKENKNTKKIQKIILEKKEKEKRINEQKKLDLENKQKELREEIRLARERSHDLKTFIRKEQAILRQEQARNRKRFLEQIKLERKIESFRKREIHEIKNLEKLALSAERDDYRSVEGRLEKIKEKYRLIREQKIRERVKSLGVEISDEDTKEDILQKEKDYAEHRQKIELVLESFYRSANSLVFQLNKRYIPKHKSILRVIDRRYETNECFIKYDDSPDEDWLILIYLEDLDAEKGKIIVENKSNSEKYETKTFQKKEIFAYSDYLVDSMTTHIDRERQKKTN